MYYSYVNGEWVNSASNTTIELYSPSTRKPIGHIQAMTKQDVNEAIAYAHAAQKDWEALPLQTRAHYLYRWADELLHMKDELAQLMMQEVGKNLKDAQNEVLRTADLIRYTVEEALHLNGESARGDQFPGGSRTKIAVIERVAVGTVLAIPPFNYPVNLAAAKLAPALMMGNSVIFKPATQGAMSGLKMIEALHKAGLPKGVLNTVTGRGSEIGDYLVEHPGINMISFTGGTNTGVRLAKKATMIPLVLELGGKDPGIVCEDADLAKIAPQIISGAFSYAGQRCTALKRLLVHESVADTLVDLLHDEIQKLAVGRPEDGCTVVPLIDEASADFVEGLMTDAIEQGATLVTGGTRQHNLIAPTLFDHVTENMRIAWEEPFGPVLPIIRVASDEEAIDLANASEYGLQASIFTENIDRAFAIANALDTGSVQINGRTERGPDHFPFIGTKKSGMGAQGVKNSLLSMTREKVTILNLSM